MCFWQIEMALEEMSEMRWKQWDEELKQQKQTQQQGEYLDYFGRQVRFIFGSAGIKIVFGFLNFAASWYFPRCFLVYISSMKDFRIRLFDLFIVIYIQSLSKPNRLKTNDNDDVPAVFWK